MAGNIFWKERAIITLTSTGASIATGTASLAATQLDCRAAGNAAEDLIAAFSLQCQWATITGITAGVNVADLYLVPAIDGTNFPDVNTTSGTSAIAYPLRAGSFIDALAPTASTNMLFQTGPVDLLPFLYDVYLMNVSGQTLTANWTLKVVTAQAQYS